MKTNQQTILTTPLADLQTGDKFLLPAQRMGFGNLQEIIDLPTAELMSNKHFSYSWMYELMDVLNKHQLLHLLDK